MNLAAVRWFLWSLLGLILLATGVGTFMARGPGSGPPEETAAPEVLPVLGQVPEFELVNRDGSRVRLKDFAGRVWVADFIFTRCAFSCPRMTSHMMRVRAALPAGVTAAMVSITVDPDNDTPTVLSDYAKSLGIDQPDWFFLTGDRESLEALTIEGFKLPIVRDPPPEAVNPGEPILHSDRFVLVDGRGRIRGYYSPNEADERERLLRDILRVSTEEPAAVPVVAGESPSGDQSMSATTSHPAFATCASEIEELHDFFGRWFRAELPATDTAFSRFERVLAPDFALIGPDGEEIGRREILDRVRAGHGSRSHGEFEIWIEEIKPRVAPAGHCLMTYQEWQQSADTTRIRLSTVLFRARPTTPYGVEWLHLHETWLPHEEGRR